MWQGGALQDLGTLGGRNSEASDIDVRGWIVGWAEDASGARRPFLYRNGAMADLGTLGGRTGQATRLNDLGWIVGSADEAGGRDRAFVRNPRRTDLVDLNTRVVENPVLRLQIAADINDSGQIVGWGRSAQDVDRAFLLTPLPLDLTAPSPGQVGQLNTMNLAGGTPGELLFLVGGLQAGSSPVPGCQGLHLDLGDPRLVASGLADDQGRVTLSVFVPAFLAGTTVRLQALDHSACRVSDRLDFTFP